MSLTPAQAQLLIDTAQNAPLQNMKHSVAVQEALNAAVEHFNVLFNPPTKPASIAPDPALPPVVPAGTPEADPAQLDFVYKTPADMPVLAVPA